MSSYDLPDGLNQKIINYCYQKMKGVNHKFLATHNIKPNLFMEVMYDKAIENMYTKGEFELADEDVQQVFIYVKSTEDIIRGFIEGRNELVGIRDEDNLVFKVRRQLDY